MRLSVVCPSRIGCRSVWLKGTLNGSGLPLPQPVYATAQILKWHFYQINNLEVRKKNLKYFRNIVFVFNMLNCKRLDLIAIEI